MTRNILELSLKGLEEVLDDWGHPGFRARQIFTWLYKDGVLDFPRMTNLPLALRRRLKKEFSIADVKIIETRTSADGTKKSLFALPDAELVEGVCIPAKRRATGCISTQVGCKFACRFCASGLSGFKRNLTCAEILEQVRYLKERAGNNLTHIVFMGSGEPLDNYENVLKATRTINSDAGFQIGARRITISTCGVIRGIKRLATEGLQIELSVSLHAADEQTRAKLMPINKKYPLKELLSVCKEYIRKTNRQVTFEYILIEGINSSLPDARRLAIILKDLKPCKVNLIPYNVVKEFSFAPPGEKAISLFKSCLLNAGINTTLRMPRGEDIGAACGQLRLRDEKK